MTSARRALGQVGERAAVAHLEARGYTVVERNVRRREGEIDIVARAPGGVLVFVEVRSRRAPAGLAAAAESVGERKQQRLAALASAYLADADLDAPARIDVITVAVDGHDRVAALAHIENAVEA